MRFSVAALLVFVVFAALGCAALTYSTPMAVWATGLTTTLAMIAASIAAIHAHGRLRIFASGIAISIWCFALGWNVFTYYDLEYGDPFYSIHFFVYGACVEDANGAYVAVGSNQPVPNVHNFVTIADNLAVLIIALFGGLFACFLQSRAARHADPSESDTPENNAATF